MTLFLPLSLDMGACYSSIYFFSIFFTYSYYLTCFEQQLEWDLRFRLISAFFFECYRGQRKEERYDALPWR